MSEEKTMRADVEPALDLSTLRLSEDLVGETRAVVERRKRVESLMAAAEEGRDQVSAEIFARVSADYRRQLDEIAAEYSPLRDRAGEELRRIKRDEVRLRHELDEVNDHLEELRFRCRVGEFDEKELRRREAEKLAVANQLQEQLKTIEGTMATANDLLGEDVEAVLRPEVTKRAMPKPSASQPAPPPAEATSPGGIRGAVPPPPVSQGTVLLATPPPAAKKVERVDPAAAAPPPPVQAPAVPAAAAAEPAAPAPEGTVLMSLPAPGAAPAPGPSDSSTQGLPQALLTRKKPDAGKTYVIDKDGLVLGRSNQCDVVVQGATVSRRHAMIRYQDGGYVIEDVSSGGGVLINGQRQKQWALKNGDEIGVGAAVFEFQGP